MTTRFSSHTQLLTSASAVLALLGAPALAQTVAAKASRSAVNQQSTVAAVTTDIDRAGVQLQLARVRAGDASVADTSIAASASANAAETSLTSDGATSSVSVPPSLSIAGRLITADADNMVANGQAMSSAPVQALALRSDIGISAGAALSAKLAVTGNDVGASAFGNQAGDDLALADVGATSGAIVDAQSLNASSGVSALDANTVRLAAGGASNSMLDLSANQLGAAATGNRADDALLVDGGSLRIPAAVGPASIVPAAGDGVATVGAQYANVGSQVASGKVSATVGTEPASFALGSINGLESSVARMEGNALGATATANRSSRGLDLQAGSIASDGAASGPTTVANVTNIQRDLGGDLVAATNGGITANIGGTLSSSLLDVSKNAQSAVATANRAYGNLLEVAAGTIDASEGLGHGAVGSAMTGVDGAASTIAAFSVQNVQQMTGASLIATMTANKVGVGIGGAIDQSMISADANSADSAATANSAVNSVSIDGDMIRSSIDLNNSQAVDGQLRSLVGTAADRAGVSLMPMGLVTASALRVSDNSLLGSSIANYASNSLSLSAGTFGNGSGHDDAAAGSLEGGYGAAGDAALANYQKLGQPVPSSGSPSGLATIVVGEFGIGGDAPIRNSTLEISNNNQRASAVGNTALDRVSLTAATISGTGSRDAGSALASSQFGEGVVTAMSDMKIGATSGIGDSSMVMTGNANQAVAAINDADNGMAVSASGLNAVSGGPARAIVSNLGAATINGDHVLSNAQFASGNAAATARTTLVNGDGEGIMSGSRFDVSDNNSVADVSANHAVNTVAFASVSGTGSSAGLANSQMNAAAVAANSDVEMGLYPTGGPEPALNGSTVRIADNISEAVARGNSADNNLSFSAGALALGGTQPAVVIGAFETDASAPALLVNEQSNYGAITARSTGDFETPLNVAGPVSSATLRVTGNNLVASAYGNAANNQMKVASLGGAPGGVLVNVQSNNGPVTASVFGSAAGAPTGLLAASSVAQTGNHLAATAIGNMATSAITAGR